MLNTDSGFPIYLEISGAPLQNGKLYFGVPGMNPVTNPVTVYWDAEGTQPAAQPVATVNGLPSRNGTPARVWVDGSYSRLVVDSKGRQVAWDLGLVPLTAEPTVASFWDMLSAAERIDVMRPVPLLDHTASLQKAIDAAPAGATVNGTPGATFKFTNLTSSKPLILDFKGASLIVDPTPAGVTTGTPALRFAGALGAGYALNSKADYTSNVVCSNLADAANFSAGDWAVIEDNAVVMKWDASVGAYSGRGQIVRVASVAGGTINLEQAVEHLYDAATAKIYKCTPVVGAKITNIGSLKEVDPGGITTGAVAINAPHLIEFAYCIAPRVENVVAVGWNLFAVHFGYCATPHMERVVGYDPFRPSNAGHGYLQRFYRCNHGIARGNRGHRCRHVVDFTNTYDCISEKNIAVDNDPAGVSFFWHGLASKRCRSVNDTSLAPTVRANAAIGWGVGNTSFAADYDAIIESPVYRGAADGIIVRSLSENTQISNPDIKITDTTATGARGITAQEGAKKTQVDGGLVDTADSGANTGNCVLVRDSSGIGTGDVFVLGTRLLAPTAGGEAVNASHTGGGLAIIDCPEIVGADVARNVINVTSIVSWLQITSNRLAGVGLAGIKVTSTPTGSYVVTGNAKNGTFTNFTDLATSTTLLNFLNGTSSTTWAVSAPSGTPKQYEIRTDDILRWIVRGNNVAETGGNAGSDFEISRRSDTGANLGLSVRILRSTGQFEFEAGDDFSRPIKVGARGFLWVDAAGKLRIKATSPTTDLDGVVVGSQA